MSATFLTTLSIVLIEIVVFLLISLTVLFLRFRKLKSALSKQTEPAEKSSGTDEKIIPYLTFLKDEINRTTDKLEESGEDEKPALSNRLELLTKEKKIIDTGKAHADNDDYWQLIHASYAGEKPETTENTNDSSNREAIYLARIKNLESFKNMFFNTQDKLKESFDTIDALKHKISEMPSSEENAQLEEMVDKLSIDNIGLNKQLDSANKELTSILNETPEANDSETATDDSTDNSAELLKQAQDENELLTTQSRNLHNENESLTTKTQSLQDENDTLNTKTQNLKNENNSLTIKTQNLQDEIESLTTQTQKLQQELDDSQDLREQISALEETLKSKEVELETLKNTSPSVNAEDYEELNSKLNNIEEENEFLTDQIQHLLLQELESSNNIQAQITSLEELLKNKENEFEALKNSINENGSIDNDELNEKLKNIEEENEFLTSQIQHLLHQEIENSNKMQEQVSSIETALRFKEAEVDALKTKISTAANISDSELQTKLESIEEENEFLTSQIQHLLRQELEASNKMQEQISNLETDLRFKEAEIDSLKNHDKSSPDAADNENWTAKLAAIEEENEFLASQIQHLLRQELEATNKMQDKMTALETELNDKKAEYDSLTNTDSKQTSNDTEEINEKLQTTLDENDFLSAQIQQLLQQELTYSNNMQTQMEHLKSSLIEKEAECSILLAQSKQPEDAQLDDLNNKLHAMEEENEFLVSQIQHLLAQEVEHSNSMLDKIQTLEKDSNNNN